MPSRDTSWNTPDWKDVTSAALEFHQDMGGPITVRVSFSGTRVRPCMTLTADLWADVAAIGVAKPLASASVLIGTGRATDTDSALLAVLYELDKELYRREVGVSPPRA